MPTNCNTDTATSVPMECSLPDELFANMASYPTIFVRPDPEADRTAHGVHFIFTGPSLDLPVFLADTFGMSTDEADLYIR
jgi:hypothetical protein